MKMNLGSGKDYRAAFVNIDINPYWKPDVVADVSKDLPFLPGSFDEIIANDILEHVHDLVATMTNCLKLLRIGGLMHIHVPYDLSYGAWQDPTHVRGFNQNSWLYYTDWFWYLGWGTYRFKSNKVDLVLDPIGQQMVNDGKTADEICRMPRAVDSMNVTLEKIELTENDKKELVRVRG